jgi:hypothetical protein
MPRRFLSKAERQRLSQFPDEVTDADCIVYFTLTPDDQALIGSRRGQENRLGMALLLCSLRYLGYFPANIDHTPENMVAFVANQARMQTAMGYFREIGQVVVDDTVPDEAVRANIYEQVPVDSLQVALDDIEHFLFPAANAPI